MSKPKREIIDLPKPKVRKGGSRPSRRHEERKEEPRRRHRYDRQLDSFALAYVKHG